MTALDVAIGTGLVAREALDIVGPSGSVTGLDPSMGMLAQAQAADNPPNLSFIAADATKGVPPGPWDAVVLSNVLEHIADRTGFLRALIAEAARELRPPEPEAPRHAPSASG